MNWVGIQIQYFEIVRRINMGMEYLTYATETRTAGNESAYKSWMEKLSDLSSGQRMNLAVRALRNGLIGKEMFQKSILDELYSMTGGDRPKLGAMAARLIQLMICRIILVVAVEGFKERKDVLERYAEIYSRELLEVQASVTTEIQRCVDNFEVNLEEDLRQELMTGDKNGESSERLMKKIEAKYDFKEMVVLIYNDSLTGYELSFKGCAVYIHDLNAKDGIVFYSDKRGQCSPQMQSAQGLVSQIADESKNLFAIYKANVGHKRVREKFEEQGITPIGTAVVKKGIDLGRAESSTASCNIIWEDGLNVTYFVFL